MEEEIKEEEEEELTESEDEFDVSGDDRSRLDKNTNGSEAYKCK